MISPATIDEIKNRVDIVDVVSDFVDLKKSGSSYRALSPFTSEKTPSFYVVPSKGIFKDFSSDKGGDAIKFIMEIDGLSYVEALKYLAKKYGIEIVEEEKTDEQLESQNKRESLYIVMQFAAEFYKDNLHKNEEGQSIGLSYFRERGFSEKTIASFELGYSLDSWDSLHKAAIGKGYQPELLEEAGLIIKKDNGKIFDRFRGRVMFPIHNLTGKVIAFGARILTKDKKAPKYLNSPESELYHKSYVLYGLYQAKNSIRQEDNCYIVEGYTDVLSLHQSNISNVVSSSGTALTAEQVRLIKRYTHNVTALFDGDAAGIRASLRGIDILLEEGMDVRAVRLPEGEDPDSYSRQLGTAAFQHYLEENSQDFIRFKTSMLLDEANEDPIKKSEIVHDVVNSISRIKDEIKRSIYIKECSTLLDVGENALLSELNKLIKKESGKNQKTRQSQVQTEETETNSALVTQQAPAEVRDTVSDYERKIIGLLLKYGTRMIVSEDEVELHIIEYILNEIEDVEFTHPVYARLLSTIKTRYEEGEATDYSYFLSVEDEEVQQTIVNLTATKYEVSEFWHSKHQIFVPSEEDMLKQVSFTEILRLKWRKVRREIENLSQSLKTVPEEQMDEKLDQLGELKDMEVEIAKFLGNVIAK